MRLFWSVFLMTGLAVILLSVSERRGLRPESTVSGPTALEDGTGFPAPYPTPGPKEQ